jgi:transposase
VSQRKQKVAYWQDAPMPRKQLVLVPTALEVMIAEDHPVRLLDEILDELDWSEWEATYHGSFGKPAIHPSLLAKVLLFAMIRRIRSSRQIEYELKHSIDFIWLTSGRHIDHTTISEFRRKNSKALRDIFRQMIKLAIDLGVVNLSELCIDGTRVLADANRYKTWTATRLAKALVELDSQIAAALDAFEDNDQAEQDLYGEDHAADRLPEGIRDLKTRREQLAKHLEQARSMDEVRKTNGTDPQKSPAQLPKTDPDSRILPNKEGGYAPNYTPMATTETQGGLIVHCDVVIGNVEHDQLGSIIDCVQSDYDVNVERVMADSAYTSGENLTIAESKDVELLGPLAEVKCPDNPAIREDLTQPVASEDVSKLPMNPQTNRFDKSAFIYDEATDSYFCPAGRQLPHRTTENTTYRGGKAVVRNVYTCGDCSGCPLAHLCRKSVDSNRGREVMHDEHEGARRRHRARMQTAEAQEDYSRRQHFGETPFAVMKTSLDMRRFLLRGIEGVGQEWRWASLAFNTKKLMRRWAGIRAQLSMHSAVGVN